MNSLPFRRAVIACIGAVVWALEPAAAQEITGAPVEVMIPFPPEPARAKWESILVYELHVTNFTSVAFRLDRVEILAENGAQAASLIGSYHGDELGSSMAHPGLPSDPPDKQEIGGGRRAIVYVWLVIKDGTPLPGALKHRLFFSGLNSDSGRIETNILEIPAVTVRKARPLVLGPPLRGSGWVAWNGPSNRSIHRRYAFPFASGRTAICERFAIDFIQLGEKGMAVRGNRNKNEDWYGYGAEVLAVADAVVSDVQDGIPENVPLQPDRAVKINLQTSGGNSVTLDLGNGRFAFFAHLQPNKIRVKPGDRVRRGQVLGLLGNSGNSTNPHLHFHVSDGRKIFEGEGLPFVFDTFYFLGEADLAPAIAVGRGEVTWKPESGVAGEKRRSEMPLDRAVVEFR